MRHSVLFARHAVAALWIITAGCLRGTEPGSPSNPATETYASSLGVNISQMTKISDDLYIQDVVVGTGAEAVAGKNLTVNYAGFLVDGTQFGSNNGQAPLPFQLGTNDVIQGWDLGVPGMKVGGRRLLVIGSTLGYGSSGSGPIPANATLVFTVQLLTVQ
ncbi:MAG: FKBP-type peptidyl-prolyl cis-trans isomerase [Gemmatimonadaceae bacterium]